jgi:hypothetical protein
VVVSAKLGKSDTQVLGFAGCIQELIVDDVVPKMMSF